MHTLRPQQQEPEQLHEPKSKTECNPTDHQPPEKLWKLTRKDLYYRMGRILVCCFLTKRRDSQTLWVIVRNTRN